MNQVLASLSPEKRALLERRLLLKNEPPRDPRVVMPSARGPRPLSFGQESLWFFDQLESNSPLYNLPQALRLRGKVDPDALRKALETILSRHESLRTNFVSVNDDPMQVVAENKTFVMPMVDLSAFAEPEREATRWLEEEAKLPFNLAEDLMLRAALLRLNASEHILFLSLHHIAADAWSITLLNEELSALYNSFCAGKPSPLPTLEFQYSDFAVCQRERFQGELASKQIAYWKEKLSGELPALELPADKSRPPQQSFRGATERVTIPSALLVSLKKLSRQENVTVYTTSLAAFQLLLQRYSRQDDILVGSPIGARHRTDTEKLIGYFINTVVLRSDLSGNPSFRELLQKISLNVLDALTHQDMPLERLVEELKVPRDASRNPLVQVLFQYLAAPIQLPKLDGLTVELVPVEMRTAKFDLTLTLRDSPEGLISDLEYNTDLFERATIQRMLGHYQVLLESIVANPSQPIASLPLLTPAEAHQILIEWNDTEVPFPENVFVPELIEQQAARIPDQIAVACGDASLSYAELNHRANQLAHHLTRFGVGPETSVGICLNRSIEMIVGILAILKAGGAYVPLDPGYPANRLSLMLKETRSPVVLTTEKWREKLPNHRGRNICLDTDWPAIANESNENLRAEVAPDHLAYVIFTSGSTGKPKGVLVTHANLLHSTMARRVYYRQPVKNYLMISSLSFDSSVAGIFWTLTSGGTLTLPEEGLHHDPVEIIRLIEEKKVSHFLSLPSLYNLILETARPQQLASLNVVIVAGESCEPELVNRHDILMRCSGLESAPTLFNEYGPTEGTVWGTVEMFQVAQTGKTTIGRPTPNARVYILDLHQRPVPIGVPGEIYIGGAGVVRGYLNRPDLTAEKFVPDPFSEKPNARLYRTGDQACFLPDGKINFLNRLDQQIKIRGYRIELEEIESALKEISGVRDAVVAACQPAAGEKYLAAFLVLSEQTEMTSADLSSQLRAKLPDYMVPSAFVPLQTLPLTPNGKVNRQALPVPDFTPDIARFVAPRNPVEQQIARVWCDVLRVERVGIHDNFFELGGHSLLAARAISRLWSAAQITLSLRDFFQAPTIAGISSLSEKGGVRKPKTAIPALARRKASAVGSSFSSVA